MATKKKAPAKPLTKTQIIDAVADATGYTKKAVEDVYAALTDLIAKETKKTAFTLPGLGKFSVIERKARTGRNIQTGEPLQIPAKKTVKFTVSKLIKDKILG